MRKLLIIGAGGHGAVVANVADEMEVFTEIAFLDDGEILQCLRFPVIGKTQDISQYVQEYEFFVAIGNGVTRKKVMENIQALGGTIATLIHPKAVIAKGVTFGEGTVVMAGAVIEPRAQVGKGCIVNTLASLNHDSKMGDYTHISAGVVIGAIVTLGEHVFVGIGAIVISNVNVCSQAFIGAGCVVIKDINEVGTYVGVPAKRITKND